MPEQRWEIIAIIVAVVLQSLYQYLYALLPNETPQLIQFAFQNLSRLADEVVGVLRQSPADSSMTHVPVYSMLQELIFEGNGKCVDRTGGSSSDLPLAGSTYTIEALVMPHEVSFNESFGIVSWGKPARNQLNGLIFFQGANSVRNVWWQNDLQAFYRKSLADGQFHHVAATWNGSIHTIAVDFEVIASRAATGYSPTSKSSFCIGRAFHWDGTHANFKGKIKDLKIWNVSRTVSEMRRDSNLPLAASPRPSVKATNQSIHSREIVLDDTDGQVHGIWHPGTFEPCLADAYNAMFHHDWGQEKGHLFGKYRFGPLPSGCYAVDEWHPGGDKSCSFYLTQVPIEVIIAGVQVARFSVDQSTRGGRWNLLGRVDLSAASVGELRTSNNGTAIGCQAARVGAGMCFWVADAFRLQRVGDHCMNF